MGTVFKFFKDFQDYGEYVCLDLSGLSRLSGCPGCPGCPGLSGLSEFVWVCPGCLGAVRAVRAVWAILVVQVVLCSKDRQSVRHHVYDLHISVMQYYDAWPKTVCCVVHLHRLDVDVVCSDPLQGAAPRRRVRDYRRNHSEAAEK